MSAADEAWQEWLNSPEQEFKANHNRASFTAGYRRALEDAADAVVSDGPKHPYNDDETTRINAWCQGLHYAAREVRARAAAADPTERGQG